MVKEASDERQITIWEKEGIKGCLKEYSLEAMVEGGRGIQVCIHFLQPKRVPHLSTSQFNREFCSRPCILLLY
jgi:hypothetical protein